MGELETINKTALNHDDTVTYEVLLDQLQTYVNGFEWREYGQNLDTIGFILNIAFTCFGICIFLYIYSVMEPSIR